MILLHYVQCGLPSIVGNIKNVNTTFRSFRYMAYNIYHLQNMWNRAVQWLEFYSGICISFGCFMFKAVCTFKVKKSFLWTNQLIWAKELLLWKEQRDWKEHQKVTLEVWRSKESQGQCGTSSWGVVLELKHGSGHWCSSKRWGQNTVCRGWAWDQRLLFALY